MALYVVLSKPAPFKSLSAPGTRGLKPDPTSEPTARIAVQDLDAQAAAEAAATPNVEIAKVFPTKLLRPLRTSPPTPKADVVWGVAAVLAQQSTATGRGVKVAVLDTGIDETHSAFAGVSLVQKDFTGSGMQDHVGHGTHCAGTIFGREVQGRRIGVAPGITTALVGKVLDDTGSGTTAMIFDALTWAIREGCAVASLSLGLDFPGYVQEKVDQGYPADEATSEALFEFHRTMLMFRSIMESAESQDRFGAAPIVIAAAGNESHRELTPPRLISASLPAAAVDISVGAVGQAPDFRMAPFSNAAPKVVAPGVDIWSAAPGGGLVAMSGTSMACPHVAGVAALWMEKLRLGGGKANREALLSHLFANTRREMLASPRVADVGYGLVTAPHNL